MTTRQRRFAGRTALVTGSSRGLGLLDVLVNNAGIIQVGPLDALREEDFRQAMETMYFAPLRLTLAALPGLRASEAGTAVTLSSVGGRIPAPRLLPYIAAEFAAAGFSQGLRAELAGTGVSVTTVLPGLVRTGSHTAARFHGRPGAEYGWFATAASMPVLSMDAERAARAIVRTAERGRPELVLTPAAKLGVRLQGVVPATTARLLGLVARTLPAAGARPRHDVRPRSAPNATAAFDHGGHRAPAHRRPRTSGPFPRRQVISMTSAVPRSRSLPTPLPHRRYAVTAPPSTGGHGPVEVIVVHWTPDLVDGRALYADPTGQRRFLIVDDCAQEITTTGRGPVLQAAALP